MPKLRDKGKKRRWRQLLRERRTSGFVAQQEAPGVALKKGPLLGKKKPVTVIFFFPSSSASTEGARAESLP
jgi:hypothetical protein